MARTSEDGFTTTIRNAIDLDGSFYPHIKAEIYPSRIYFEGTPTENHPIDSPDAKGIVIDPVRQDIEYFVNQGGLVTYYVSGSTLYYAVQGTSGGSVLSGADATSVKPGVLGTKLYAYVGSDIRRYSIALSGTSVSYNSVYITPSCPVDAVHAISPTEAIGIMEDEGGFRPVYMSDSSKSECTSRFMFHCAIEPTPKTEEEIREGKTDDTRTMLQKAIHSGAARLDNKVFVYMSNARSGMVEGVYYDIDTDTWSNVFTVLPTDLQVSLCEFRIANAYTHNDTIYICGLFNRTDNLEGAEPYSLLLFSQNGKTFSVNRNTMVSNIGYRFLARTGGNNLYLGNCNRVCYAPITWVFDGADGTGVVVNINENNIKSYSDSDLSRCNLSLRSGLEQYFPENIPQVIEGARLVMYAGLQTASAIEYVKYATYIIDSINYDIGVDRRGMTLTATNEALWNLTGLSMPFYAEILGKSACFDPMQMDTSMLSAVGNGCIAANSFQVDFWDHEGYTNTGLGITPVDLNLQGGVNYYEPDAPTPNHWFGIIMREEIQYKLALNDNPVITDTTIHAKAYGWSSCPNTGDSNDHIHIMIQVTDDEGVDHDYVATGAQHWKQTYFDNVAGTDPVEFDFTAAYYGFEVGWKIKKVGLSFYSADDTRFCPARVEFTAGVRAFYPLYGADTPWETEKDWGYYKLPKAGKPFIMIATGPYNAFNFSLAARFKNDVEDLANYGAFTGLVGHCEDGLNYTVGRYDKRTGYAQIVICRDGIEQILDDALVSFTVIDTDDTLQMRFDHKDGHFELYMVRVSSGCFEKVLDYDWEEANGYMYTSDIASMRCGIYGFIEAPLARTLGYQELGDEEDVSGQGIPFDPLWSTANFPSNGTIRLEDNVYQYYTKVAHPSYSIGPYQFRCMGWYDVDLGYGDGYALDCRDFDWLADEYSYDGYIVTISSGVNFIVNRIDWQIFITTGGSTVWLRNRCRIYSADVLIGKLYHSLSNKVWVTGGLLGDFASDPTLPIKLISGEKATHSEGEFAVYERAGEIFCYWYQGTGGEDDTTIGDMVQKICDLSGAQCQFPSDYTHGGTNLTVTTTPQDIQTTDYAEGFDLSFDVASFGSLTLRIDFNAKIKPDNYENKSLFEDDTDIRVNITYSGSGNFVYSVVSLPSNTVIYSCQFSTNTGVQKFRVMAMGNNIGFYHNGQWVTTVALNEIDYENSLIITLSTSTSSLILSNIRESDLSDWREAIYIDLETDGTSALSSVIQQRPIEMFAKPDGSIDFWYDATRTTVTAGREPRTHSYSHVFPSSGASDAIIYGLKDVKTIQDENFARVVGFATKMMRMPDLGIGAMRAAHIILKRLLESAHKHSVDIRPDLELEPGDVYTVSYDDQNKVPSARTASIVVEAVSYEFRASEAQATARMQIQGREEYDEPA